MDAGSSPVRAPLSFLMMESTHHLLQTLLQSKGLDNSKLITRNTTPKRCYLDAVDSTSPRINYLHY